MTPMQYEEFRHSAVHELNMLVEQCRQQYLLGEWERWDYDEEFDRITFSTTGRSGVVCDVSVVGTTSVLENTWLWSWANQSISASRTSFLDSVRAFGHSESIPALTEPSWPLDE